MLRITPLKWKKKKAYLLTIAGDKATTFNSARLDKMLLMSWVQPFGIIIAVTTEGRGLEESWKFLPF